MIKLEEGEQHKAERKRKIMFIMNMNKLWLFRSNKILIYKLLFFYSFAICEEVVMKLEQEEQRKAEQREKTNDQCCKGHRFIFRNLFLEIYF